jgi:hypothetical protein
LADVDALVTGWGRLSSGISPDQLYQAQVPIIANTLCNDANHYDGLITANMLCAGPVDIASVGSCKGDSGGPLVVQISGRWQLAGVVSWGDETCSRPKYSGVFTRVSNFVSWINSYVPNKSGDANGDGEVDGVDYVIWRANYNMSTSNGPSNGDFNNSGFVDGVDYVIWLNNYGK